MAQITLDEAVQDYLLNVKIRQRSLKTLRVYSDCLRVFREFSPDGDILPARFGSRFVDTFTARDVLRFFDGLDDHRRDVMPKIVLGDKRDPNPGRRARPASKATRHAYARALRSLFRWCAADGLIDKPVKVEMPSLEYKEIPVIRPNEITAILKAARKRRDESLVGYRNYVLCVLLATTGARRNEILNLEVGDFDFESDPPMVLFRTGKGGKQKRLVIDPEYAPELLRYTRLLRRNEIDFLIFSDRRPNQPLQQDVPYRILTRLAQAAGVDPKGVAPHRWRHAFLSAGANAGINLAVLQDMAGHASIMTTRRYVKTTPEAQRVALEAIRKSRKHK